MRTPGNLSRGRPFRLGDSTPLGLLGFTIAALMAAVIKISSTPGVVTSGFFASSIIFLGGFAQILTAIFQLLQNNSHAASIFGLYGFHGLTVGVQLWVASTDNVNFISPGEELPSATYSGLLAVMTLLLFLPTFRMNVLFSALLLLVLIVFATEVPAAYGVRGAELASGIVQALSGALGAYLAALTLINETWQKEVLPIFPYKQYRNDHEDAFEEVHVPRMGYIKSVARSM